MSAWHRVRIGDVVALTQIVEDVSKQLDGAARSHQRNNERHEVNRAYAAKARCIAEGHTADED